MCGRYSLALRPSQIRQMLEEDDMEVEEAPEDEGDEAPRQSYNFAPGYHGVVYRADVPDRGAGPHASRERGHSHKAGSKAAAATSEEEERPAEQQRLGGGGGGRVHYKLQSMKWGLVPFWTKRNPDYGSVLKTINCRDDSLAAPGGMWASMKGRKRCIVIAQGFYEWLKPGGPGPKEKIPHYVKRADGRLMCFAGLWDCVRYEGEGTSHYTYTIITTDSNTQLRFLHDRMPVILDPGSDAIRTWLDPGRYEWSAELQRLLKPYDGPLEVYPVSKEVGKVGNNSPSFIVPVASRDNKNNIANFFSKGGAKKGKGEQTEPVKPEVEMETEAGRTTLDLGELGGATEIDSGRTVGSPVKGVQRGSPVKGVKREAASPPGAGDEPAVKKLALAASPAKEKNTRVQGKISATSNTGRSPAKKKGKVEGGSQKITKFFGNSA